MYKRQGDILGDKQSRVYLAIHDVWQIKENILLPVGSRVPVALWQKGFVRRHEWTRHNMLRVEKGSGARQDGKFDVKQAFHSMTSKSVSHIPDPC